MTAVIVGAVVVCGVVGCVLAMGKATPPPPANAHPSRRPQSRSRAVLYDQEWDEFARAHGLLDVDTEDGAL